MFTTKRYYESVEFTLPANQTDYDLDSNQADFLVEFGPASDREYATQVRIRTDQTITVKLNATTNDAITITSNDSPFDIKGVEIRNVFLTNTTAAAVKLLFQDLESNV